MMEIFFPLFNELEFSVIYCDTPDNSVENNSVALSFLRRTASLNSVNVAMGYFSLFSWSFNFSFMFPASI